MNRDPRPLAQARHLYELARAGEHYSEDEVQLVREQLRSRAVHPSCDDELRQRIQGMLLVLDLMAIARTESRLHAVASS